MKANWSVLFIIGLCLALINAFAYAVGYMEGQGIAKWYIDTALIVLIFCLVVAVLWLAYGEK